MGETLELDLKELMRKRLKKREMIQGMYYAALKKQVRQSDTPDPLAQTTSAQTTALPAPCAKDLGANCRILAA